MTASNVEGVPLVGHGEIKHRSFRHHLVELLQESQRIDEVFDHVVGNEEVVAAAAEDVEIVAIQVEEELRPHEAAGSPLKFGKQPQCHVHGVAVGVAHTALVLVDRERIVQGEQLDPLAL